MTEKQLIKCRQNEFTETVITRFKDNLEWSARNAMVGTIGEDRKYFYVKKPKGSQGYLTYKQNTDNSFLFFLQEAISLMLSKRLVILSLNENQISQVTVHQMINHMNNFGVTMKSLSIYSLFTRVGASRRKQMINDDLYNGSNDKRVARGFAQNLIKMQTSCASMIDVSDAFFKATTRIRIPDNHGIPSSVCLTLPQIDDSISCDSVLLSPMSLKLMIEVHKIPDFNTLKKSYQISS